MVSYYDNNSQVKRRSYQILQKVKWDVLYLKDLEKALPPEAAKNLKRHKEVQLQEVLAINDKKWVKQAPKIQDRNLKRLYNKRIKTYLNLNDEVLKSFKNIFEKALRHLYNHPLSTFFYAEDVVKGLSFPETRLLTFEREITILFKKVGFANLPDILDLIR